MAVKTLARYKQQITLEWRACEQTLVSPSQAHKAEDHDSFGIPVTWISATRWWWWGLMRVPKSVWDSVSDFTTTFQPL